MRHDKPFMSTWLNSKIRRSIVPHSKYVEKVLLDKKKENAYEIRKFGFNNSLNLNESLIVSHIFEKLLKTET